MQQKIILHKTKIDYVCELIINEECKSNTSLLETIIILDRSGSMGNNTEKLINRVFPKVFDKLKYNKNDTIHLITFDSVVEHLTLSVKDFPSHPIYSRGGTKMFEVISKLEDIFTPSKKKYRICTISDGDVWDQEETVNEASKLAKKIKGLYAINSQAVRLFTSSSEPDTRAISSLLQLHSLKKASLENVDANLPEEKIAEIIANLFATDSLEYDFVLHSKDMKEDLWSKKQNELILNQGKNLFWIDSPQQFKISINGKESNVPYVNGVEINKESYQKILQDKINKYVQKIKVLKIVDNAESSAEIETILNHVEKYEKNILNSVPCNSIISKLNNIANKDIKSLSANEQAEVIQSSEGLDEDNYLDPRFAKIDPTEFYDVIIRTNMFEDLKSPDQGWEVLKSEEAKNNYENLVKDKISVIGVVGVGNRGKSYILSKLSGFTLPDGYSVETEGISLKYYKESETKQLVLLDSAGSSTALVETNQFSLNDIDNVEEANRKIQDISKDKSIMEIFLQKFIINYANVILAVVGQMTYNEQKLLNRLKKYSDKKTIIVVHNLMNFTKVEQVKNYIEHTLKRIITFNLLEQTYVTFGEKINTNQNNIYFKESDNEGKGFIHLIFGCDLRDSETKEYYNEKGFEYLRKMLSSITSQSKFDVIKSIQKHLTSCSTDFMNEEIQKENIKYKNDRLFVENVDIKLKNILYSEMGDSNFLGSLFEPKYSVWLQEPKTENIKQYIEYFDKKNILQSLQERKDFKSKIEKFVKDLENTEQEGKKIGKKNKKIPIETVIKLKNNVNKFLESDSKIHQELRSRLSEKKGSKELVIELEVAGEKPDDLKTKFKNIEDGKLFTAKGTKKIKSIKGEVILENQLKQEKFESKIKIPVSGDIIEDQAEIIFKTTERKGKTLYTGVIQISVPYSPEEMEEQSFDL